MIISFNQRSATSATIVATVTRAFDIDAKSSRCSRYAPISLLTSSTVQPLAHLCVSLAFPPTNVEPEITTPRARASSDSAVLLHNASACLPFELEMLGVAMVSTDGEAVRNLAPYVVS